MASFDEFINSILLDGNDGKAFELFCKHFLETSPDYADLFEKVWLWPDWPHRWTRDKGIDLIAKYKGREKYCAIQAKCRDAHDTVPYNEVTNFLADSNRELIEDRILMMSTNKLSETTSREIIQGQEKRVVIRDRHYFENIPFEYPSHISKIFEATQKKKAEPRPHQRRAITDVVNGFAQNDRGQLIMACGTGKTFTTLWIKESLKAKTAIVLLPSLSLLSQTMREWVWGAKENFQTLAVCSDPTVQKAVNEDVSVSEVGKVTWDVEEIRAFLKTSSSKVIFCTYQSSELIQEAQQDKSIEAFDLVVCDEAHRCSGSSDSRFSTVLDEDKIRASKRLFTTATPRYYSKSISSQAEGRGVQIIGMDDETKFGAIMHQLTFGEAISLKILTDYQVVVVGVSEPMVKEWITEGEMVSTGEGFITDARTIASQIAVLKSIKDFQLRRLISFHNRIKQASDFANRVDETSALIRTKKRPNGKIWSSHVDGTMTAGKRRDLINQLKDLDGVEIGLLANSQCLSEGVDVPSLDGIAFVDPRSSQVDIIQAVGRAIRKSENKVKGTIIIPVFIEEGDDPDTIIEASNFKPVWSVLKALRAHDEVLADEIDQFRTNIGRGSYSKSNGIDKIILDLPKKLDKDFASSLTIQLVEATSESWNYWYGLLENFKAREDHVNVPSGHLENNHKLGYWVSNQRSRKSILTPKQIEKLDQIGFIWDATEYAWEIGLKELKKFKESNGHCLVPTNHKKIGTWVVGLRSRKASHSKERIKVLNELGFIWDIKEAAWEEKFRELSEFEKIHGTCLVPETHSGRNGLYNWIIKQRRDLNNKKVYLTKEKIDKLDSINFIWNVDEYEWNKNFQALKKYFKEHNHVNVPANYTLDNIELGIWVRYLRRPDRNISDQRRKSLNDLGFSWDIAENFWNEGYSHLKKFIAREGHPKVPFGHIEDNFKLGGWVATQRSRKEKLSYEKQKKLNDVEFVWNSSTTRWEKNYKALLQFRKREGHCIVRQGHRENGLGLGNWVRSQRAKYKEGRLPKNEFKQLNDLGFVWDATNDPWDETFKLLLKFKDRESHCIVSQDHIEDGFALGRWVTKQRHKKNLSAERREILNQIGFVWDPHKKKWEDAYKHLISFYKREGHCIVYRAHKENGFGLGAWVMSQAKKKDKLSDEQKQKLNDLGFDWKVYRD